MSRTMKAAPSLMMRDSTRGSSAVSRTRPAMPPRAKAR